MMKQHFVFIILLFLNNYCLAEYRYPLSICTIFRDEAPYLKEWIEYHRMLGVEHFYLCNHVSKDNYKEVLEPYIRDGIVELKEFLSESKASVDHFCYNIQVGFFNEVLDRSRGVSKWVAFLDADEFLLPIESDSLVEFLKDYEEFGGLSLNWCMFGTSHVCRLDPEKLMIQQLTACSSINHRSNTFVKCLVQPRYTIKFPNPHFALYMKGFYSVDTNKQPLGNPLGHNHDIVIDKLKLNHYWTRDENYFLKVKLLRQLQRYGEIEIALQLYRDFMISEDLTIQRFVPKLRKRMGLE